MTEFLAIVTTTDERAVAEAIADAVVAGRLAACARISSAESVYRWKGEICRTPEHVIEIKTTAARAAEVEQAIRERHNYELPEILRLPILGGSESYLNLLREESSPGG